MSDLRLIHGTADNHGRISAPGANFLPTGGILTFTAMPEPGYEVDTWSINGVVAPSGDISFNVTAQNQPQYVQVTFRPITSGLLP